MNNSQNSSTSNIDPMYDYDLCETENINSKILDLTNILLDNQYFPQNYKINLKMLHRSNDVQYSTSTHAPIILPNNIIKNSPNSKTSPEDVSSLFNIVSVLPDPSNITSNITSSNMINDSRQINSSNNVYKIKKSKLNIHDTQNISSDVRYQRKTRRSF